MGSSDSKHSTRSDVLPNLQWSLNELMLWRQRAAEDKLAEEQATRMYARSGIIAPGSGIGDIPSRDLREVGLPSNIGGGGVGGGTTMGGSGGNIDTANLQSTSTLQPSTTTTTTSSMSSSTFQPTSAVPTPGMSTTTTGEMKQMPMGSTGSMVEAPNLEAQLEVDRADGLIIRQKYLFILDHIEQLVLAAEQNYMTICKENWLKSLQSKVNTSLATGPTTKAELERKIVENNSLLMKDLGDWDNARAAIHWLLRHFDLLVQRRMLAREITHINNRIRVLQVEAPSQDSLDEIRNLRARLNAAHEGVAVAKKDAKQLHRESLAVGLQYLDVNQSGSIEPADQPQLRSELFSRLDIRHKHKITVADLQSAVDKMEKNVEHCQQRVLEAELDLKKHIEDRDRALHLAAADPSDSEKRRAKIEQMNVDIQRREENIMLLRQQKDRERTFLRDTYSMFQRAFVESLFDKLGRRRLQDKAMYDAYREEMSAIERNINNLHIAADQGSKGLAATHAVIGSKSQSYTDRRKLVPISPVGGVQSVEAVADRSAAVPQAPPMTETLSTTTTQEKLELLRTGGTGNLTDNIQKAALQRQQGPLQQPQFQQTQT